MSPIKLSGKRAPTNPTTLSQEQQQIIQAVVEKQQNVIVNAVAGSGKTTTILALIKALQVQRQRQGLPTNFLVLMFNTDLKKESTAKAISQKIMTRPKKEINNPFKTFHSAINLIEEWLKNAGFTNNNCLIPELANDPDYKQFQQAWNFKQQNNPTTADSTGVAEFLDALAVLMQKSELFCNHFFVHNRAIPNYDLICFDESQDLYGNLSWKIVQLLVTIALKRQRALKIVPARFLFVGDENQAIYTYQGADPRFITLAPFLLEELKLIHLPLSTSYRITPPMAAVASQLIKPKLKIVAANNQVDMPPVKLTLCPNVEGADWAKRQMVVQMIVDEIVLKIQSGVPANQILVLTRSNVGDKDANQGGHRMFKLIEEIRAGLYQKQIVCEDLNKHSQTNKVQMLTMHKAKGLEAQHVIVLGLTNDEILKFEDYDFIGWQDNAPNLHYVALTRAKQSLSIYIIPFAPLKYSPLPAYLINQANVIMELQNEGHLQWNNLSGLPDDVVFFKRAPVYQHPQKLKLVFEPSKIDDLPKTLWEQINHLRVNERQDHFGAITLPQTIQGKLFQTNQADVADLKTTLGSLITFITLNLMQNEQINDPADVNYYYPSQHIHNNDQPCLRPFIDKTFTDFWTLIERIYIRNRIANLDPLIDFFENTTLTNILKQRIQNLMPIENDDWAAQIRFEGDLLIFLQIAFSSFWKPDAGWRTLADWKALEKLPATNYPKLHDFWQALIDHFGAEALLEWQKMFGIFDFYTPQYLVEIKTGKDVNLQKAQIQLVLYAYFLQLNNELCKNHFEERVKQKVDRQRFDQYTVNPVDEVLVEPEFLVAFNLTTGQQIVLKNDPAAIKAIAQAIIINELAQALKISDQEFVDRYRLIL